MYSPVDVVGKAVIFTVLVCVEYFKITVLFNATMYATNGTPETTPNFMFIMSDQLDLLDVEKFRHEITVDTNHCLQYVKKQSVNAEEIVLAIHLTNQILKTWHDVRQKATSCTFIDLLNTSLAENHPVLIKRDCKRIEENLRRLASTAKSNFKGKQGRAYLAFSKATRSISIRHGEFRNGVHVVEVERELYDLKAEKKALEEENERLHKRCDELYQSLLKADELKKGSDETLSGAYEAIEKLKAHNTNFVVVGIYRQHCRERGFYKHW